MFIFNCVTFIYIAYSKTFFSVLFDCIFLSEPRINHAYPILLTFNISIFGKLWSAFDHSAFLSHSGQLLRWSVFSHILPAYPLPLLQSTVLSIPTIEVATINLHYSVLHGFCFPTLSHAFRRNKTERKQF